EFQIGVGADLAGHGAVVDQRRLVAAPCRDMAVDGVVAGVADAAGEPAAVDAVMRIECGVEGPIPVDALRRLAPESLRIALPAFIDFVIARRHVVLPSGLLLPPYLAPQGRRGPCY